MTFPFGETVTVLTAGTVNDPYSGEATPSWDVTPAELTVVDVAVEPRPSDEPVQDARHAVTSGYTLYMPAETTITSADRVVVRGSTLDVLGEPAVWRSPYTGWHPGIVVQVARTQG